MVVVGKEFICFPKLWRKLGYKALSRVSHFLSATVAAIFFDVLRNVLGNFKPVAEDRTNPGAGRKQKGLFIFHFKKSFVGYKIESR